MSSVIPTFDNPSDIAGDGDSLNAARSNIYSDTDSNISGDSSDEHSSFSDSIWDSMSANESDGYSDTDYSQTSEDDQDAIDRDFFEPMWDLVLNGFDMEEFLERERTEASFLKKLSEDELEMIEEALTRRVDWVPYYSHQFTRAWSLSCVSPDAITPEQAMRIFEGLQGDYDYGMTGNDSVGENIPTGIRALTSALGLKPLPFSPASLDDRQGEVLRRKTIEFHFQVLFNISDQLLSELEDPQLDHCLMRVLQIVISSRLQIQVFLRRASRKYRTIETTLSDEEKNDLLAQLQEMEAHEQQYRQKEHQLKARILEIWKDLQCYLSWHVREQERQEFIAEDFRIWARDVVQVGAGLDVRTADQITEFFQDHCLDPTYSENQSCKVCRDPYLGAEDLNDSYHPGHTPIQLPCNHIFGRSCILEWIEQTSSCPLCSPRAKTYMPEKTQWIREPSPEWDGINWPAVTPEWLALELLEDEQRWNQEPIEEDNGFETVLGLANI